jgi:hypothetical protein
MRNKVSPAKKQDAQKSSLEDDLKWVEENVPATLTEALVFFQICPGFNSV